MEPDGIISTVAGSGAAGSGGDSGLAAAASMTNLIGVAAAPDGSLSVADQWENRIRQVKSALPGLNAGDHSIASEDGSEVYIFNSGGRHLRTIDSLTNSVRYEFDYDDEGRLVHIIDLDGNVTAIERSGTGAPTAIVGPLGQRNSLTLDANGYLAKRRANREPRGSLLPDRGELVDSESHQSRLPALRERAHA